MIFIFRVVSPALASGGPASDLDGEEWEFQDTTYARASQRAYARLADTFSHASAERIDSTHLAFVGEFRSLQTYRKAEESGVVLPSIAKVGMPARDVDTVLAVALAEDLARSA